MSRQPDRSRSRRVVLTVVLFLCIVAAARDDECGEPTPLATAGVLAATGLLPRLVLVFGRVLVLVSQPGRVIRPRCPAGG